MIKKNYLPIFAVGFLLLPLTTAVAQENTEIRLLCDFRSNHHEYLNSGKIVNDALDDLYLFVQQEGGNRTTKPSIAIGSSSSVFDPGYTYNRCETSSSWRRQCLISDNQIEMNSTALKSNSRIRAVLDRRTGEMIEEKRGGNSVYTRRYACDIAPTRKF